MIAFFTYGHIFNEIESAFGTPIRHRYLMLIYAGIFLPLAIFILWKVKKPDTLINFLTVTGLILTVFSIARTLQYDLSVYQSARLSNNAQSSLIQNVSDTTATQKPDIYLILLDAHTSVRTLKEEFNYDASPFLQQLKDLGFYVAECAQSNYPITKLSVTSVFYANYHQEPTLYPVYSSLVIETLRSEGYRVITFENRSNGHFDIGEDMRLSRNQMLLSLPEMEGPKFVFAHFLVPHPPFIFTPDGKFHWAEQQAPGYASNAKFIDSQIVPVVAEIIKNSKIPPVIIIMGDHGATGVPKLEIPQRRMSILNAYYVNDKAKKDLYETITPVNSFRIVFNNYFGTKYSLLEDLSYHSANMNKFTPENLIANKCQVSP